MEIKEMFKKYFRSPMAKMILNNGTTKDANKFLLEQMLSSKGGELIVKYNSNNVSDVSYIRLDETNAENAFRSNAWNNMSLEDRVKSINLMIKKCEKNMGIKKPLALTVIPREDIPDNEFNTAFYADGYNEIFLNMDKLEKVNGPRMFNTLVHECTHAKDYQTIKSAIIPKLLSTCYNDTTNHPTSLITGDQIVNINIDGILDNNSGGENIRITPEIRREILMAKNIFAVCQNKGICSLEKVNNKDDYEKYVETIMYYASPLERSARVNALIETNKMFEKEMQVGVSFGDMEYLKTINNSEKYIDKEIARAGQLFGNSINDTFDIFCKYRFYNDNFDTLNKMSTTRKSANAHIKPVTKDYVDNIKSCYYEIDKELG